MFAEKRSTWIGLRAWTSPIAFGRWPDRFRSFLPWQVWILLVQRDFHQFHGCVTWQVELSPDIGQRLPTVCPITSLYAAHYRSSHPCLVVLSAASKHSSSYHLPDVDRCTSVMINHRPCVRLTDQIGISPHYKSTRSLLDYQISSSKNASGPYGNLNADQLTE